MAARRPLPPLPEPPAPNGQAPTDLTARTAASTSSPAPAHLPLRIRLQILVWTAAARLRPYLLGGAAAILASPHLPHLHLWDRQHLLGPLTLARVVVGAPGYAAVALLAEATRVGLPAYMRRSRRLRAEYDAARRHAEARRRFDRYVDHADRFDPHADYG